MAKELFPMPPDIIQAIQRVASSGGTAKVKIVHGSWDVKEELVRTVARREI